jgi:hypothetical protein
LVKIPGMKKRLIIFSLFFLNEAVPTGRENIKKAPHSGKRAVMNYEE